VVQRGGSLRFTLESAVGTADLWPLRPEEILAPQSDEAGSFSFVDHTHPTAAEFLNDAIMRDGFADRKKGLRTPQCE